MKLRRHTVFQSILTALAIVAGGQALGSIPLTRTLTIKPSHPNDACTVDLPPSASAKVTIQVNTEPGWVIIAGPKKDYFPSSSGIVWTEAPAGSMVFAVLNTATQNEQTEVKVTCKWGPGGGGGGGGGGGDGVGGGTPVTIDGLANAMAKLLQGTHLAWTFSPPAQEIGQYINWSVSLYSADGNVGQANYSVCPTDINPSSADWYADFSVVMTCKNMPRGNFTFTFSGVLATPDPSTGKLHAHYVGMGGNTGDEDATTTLPFLKVEITPSMSATESQDSGTFTCSVTPAGLSPTYQWLAGSANGAWPATAGNSPELDYSARTASATTVKKTRWFAPTPSRRQNRDGLTCSYNVNCEVTVGGMKFRAPAPASLAVTVNLTGQTTTPMFQNWNSITVAKLPSSGVGGWIWMVTGPGSFSRTAPVASVNVPAASQFHAKAMVHENKHVTQWTSETPWKDLFDANRLYNSTLSALTSAISEADLRSKIFAAVAAQAAADTTVKNNTVCDRESGAFAAMNAVDPDFLELDEADWKPLYGCP